MKRIERVLESVLFNSRFVVLVAVISSLVGSLAMFYVAAVDTWITVSHLAHYADPSLTEEARRAIHDSTVGHVVEIVDGFLLATVLLIFALGLYELFVSKIEVNEADHAENVLVIRDLDDLKNRLAKVILMILIVTFFERVIGIRMTTPLDVLYFAAGIALIGAALWLSHAAEGKKGGEKAPGKGAAPQEGRAGEARDAA